MSICIILYKLEIGRALDSYIDINGAQLNELSNEA